MTDLGGTAARHGTVLVVGVGNSLRGDDAAAAIAVRQVQRLDLPGVRILTTHQLVPELAEAVGAAGRAVFVDAAVGRSRVLVARVVPRPGPPRSHHLEPAGILGLVSLLHLPVPDAFEVAIPAHRFTLGAPLSPGTAQAVAAVVPILRRLCIRPVAAAGPGRASR